MSTPRKKPRPKIVRFPDRRTAVSNADFARALCVFAAEVRKNEFGDIASLDLITGTEGPPYLRTKAIARPTDDGTVAAHRGRLFAALVRDIT